MVQFYRGESLNSTDLGFWTDSFDHLDLVETTTPS